jgi:predicted dehydrogenase
MNAKTMNRRSFLKTIGALTVSSPYIISSSAFGKGRSLPSERITLGAIGIGARGRSVLKHFLTFNEVQCLAVCDAQKKHLDLAKAIVDEHYQNQDCIAYHDFRDLLANKNIDAVLIATGDRWHAVASIMAAKAGKDIYSEKPMSLTIEEGRALVETTHRFGTVYQCGHQRRSVDSYRFQTEVVQMGMIGKVHTVIAKSWKNGICTPQAAQPVPDGLDYDMWLGPTPYHPFIPVRFHSWNNFWDTGGGTMINMACHYTDIAQWGLGRDDTGPIDFEGWAEFDKNNFADVPVTAEVTCIYADGTKLILKSQGAFRDRFIRFVGTEGWIQVDDETNVVTAEPKSLLKRRGISARSWAHPGDHIQNFLDCIRSRRETVCSPEKSHRATTIGHIANICNRLGHRLKWDPKTEQFINDPEANKMLSRSMRPPWHL